MIKLMIFDLDGTILNTLEDLYFSANYALTQNQFPERSLDEIRQFVGNGIRKLMERIVPENTSETKIQQVHEVFTSHYEKHCADHTAPYSGIPEVLRKIRLSGCKTAVVSNKADYAVQILCQKYFPDLFDVAIGEKNNIRKKPAPDAVFSVLEKLNIQPEQAIYIGDSDVDILTAEHAHMPCISVEWGFRDRNFLLQHGAKKIISRPEELLSCCFSCA